MCLCVSVSEWVSESVYRFSQKSSWPIWMTSGRMMYNNKIEVPFKNGINQSGRTHTSYFRCRNRHSLQSSQANSLKLHKTVRFIILKIRFKVEKNCSDWMHTSTSPWGKNMQKICFFTLRVMLPWYLFCYYFSFSVMFWEVKCNWLN